MLIAASLIRFLSYNEVDTQRYAATGGLSKLFVDMFWQDKTLYIECEIRFCFVYNARIKCIEIFDESSSFWTRFALSIRFDSIVL